MAKLRLSKSFWPSFAFYRKHFAARKFFLHLHALPTPFAKIPSFPLSNNETFPNLVSRPPSALFLLFVIPTSRTSGEEESAFFRLRNKPRPAEHALYPSAILRP